MSHVTRVRSKMVEQRYILDALRGLGRRRVVGRAVAIGG